MFGFLIVINIIICVLLMIVILMQSSKGGGLAGSFGGGNMGAVFGVRRTADFLSKVTTILAVLFLVITLMINFFFLPGKGTSNQSIIQSGNQEQLPTVPQAPVQRQSAPASGQQQSPAPQQAPVQQQ